MFAATDIHSILPPGEYPGVVAMMVTYHFPARGALSPVRLVWYDGGLRPARPAAIRDGDLMGDNGHLLIGERGVISISRRKWRLFADSLAREYGEPPRRLERSPGHHEEWVAACKGGTPAGSHFDWAGPLTEAVLLGNVTLRPQLRERLTEIKLLWDAEAFAFSNQPEADHFLRREYREGWREA